MRSRPSAETKNSMDKSNRNLKNASSPEATQGKNNSPTKIRNRSARNNPKRTNQMKSKRRRRKDQAKRSRTRTTTIVIFDGNRINSI